MTGDDRELDLLVERLGRQRFVNHEMRLASDGRPNVLGFVRDWGNGVADVVVLFDEAGACAWRTAIGLGTDVFAPDLVSWSYAHTPVWTLRAMLSLPPPGDPDEPVVLMPLPAGCKVLERHRMGLRVRRRQR